MEQLECIRKSLRRKGKEGFLPSPSTRSCFRAYARWKTKRAVRLWRCCTPSENRLVPLSRSFLRPLRRITGQTFLHRLLEEARASHLLRASVLSEWQGGDWKMNRIYGVLSQRESIWRIARQMRSWRYGNGSEICLARNSATTPRRNVFSTSAIRFRSANLFSVQLILEIHQKNISISHGKPGYHTNSSKTWYLGYR